MYFAKNTENLNLNLYLLLINKYLEEGQEDYKQVLEEIIINAHDLATEKISHYDVKSNIYDIVNLFVKSNKDYFANSVNPENITKQVFETVQKFLFSLASSNSRQHA